MRRFLWSLPALGVLLAFEPAAEAAEITRVATAFEENNRFDFHFGVSYDFNYKRAAILREWNNGSDDRNLLVKDLVFTQTAHIITPKLEIGLWHDLSFYAALPIVANMQRAYEFDQRDDDCRYTSTGGQVPNCVDKNNSTTLRDGILPDNGFDASHANDPFGQFTGDGRGAGRIFNSPGRRGLDQLFIGLKYGILNQTKHSHLPNWIVGIEGRFAVGRAMTFSRDISREVPDGNQRVGRRTHEMGVWTALSRRYTFFEPFFAAYWRQAFKANGSLFEDLSDLGAQDKIQPQSQTGLSFGTEIIPWERAAKQQKVSIIVLGRSDLHYGGRGYSEIWELLADSPALVGSRDPRNAANCDPVATAQAYNTMARDNRMPNHDYLTGSCQRHNGITDIQDYATFGLNLALNFHFGPYARLNLGTDIQTQTRHFLTAADRGKANGSGSDDTIVERGTNEVNPVRRDVIDDVGRRYAIDDVLNLYAYLNFLLTF